MLRSKPRVLLVAHHANPEWGSEPLIGWRWASQLEPFADVTLVTHIRNRDAIERAGGVGRDVHYVDTERLAARVARWNDRLWPNAPVNRLFLEALTLRAFDREAVRIARRLVADGEIDLIHRVSPISPRFPSRLGSLGVPFVLGPVNGGMQTAPGFDAVRRTERDWLLGLRGLARLLDPGASTFQGADRILAATAATERLLPTREAGKVVRLSENAVDLDSFSPRFERSGSTLRILYLGRLLAYKGVDRALIAVARAAQRIDLHLDVVGEGPERGRLERLASELHIDSKVTFHGACAVEEVPSWMERCDVYAFPSVRESGGSTVLEAMAAGKPVLVADHGGPSETVTPAVGRLLSVASPEQQIEELAAALLELGLDEPQRRAMGEAARAHVERAYTWSAKCRSVSRLYREVLKEATPDSPALSYPTLEVAR